MVLDERTVAVTLGGGVGWVMPCQASWWWWYDGSAKGADSVEGERSCSVVVAVVESEENSKEGKLVVEGKESQEVLAVVGASTASKSKSKVDPLTNVALSVLKSFCTVVSWLRNSEKSSGRFAKSA